MSDHKNSWLPQKPHVAAGVADETLEDSNIEHAPERSAEVELLMSELAQIRREMHDQNVAIRQEIRSSQSTTKDPTSLVLAKHARQISRQRSMTSDGGLRNRSSSASILRASENDETGEGLPFDLSTPRTQQKNLDER